MGKKESALEAWEASVLQRFEAQGKKGLRPISARQIESLRGEDGLASF